jgi:hypothetical protein
MFARQHQQVKIRVGVQVLQRRADVESLHNRNALALKTRKPELLEHLRAAEDRASAGMSFDKLRLLFECADWLDQRLDIGWPRTAFLQQRNHVLAHCVETNRPGLGTRSTAVSAQIDRNARPFVAA